MGIMMGKVCVVTGGGGSLGKESARKLLEEGAKVMLVDNNQGRLDQAGAEFKAAGFPIATACADVSDAHQAKSYLEQAAAKLGRIDVIFSNAGISGIIAPVTEYPEDIFDAVLKINVRSAFLACKYGLPLMNDGGSIIFTSSVVGVTSDPGISGYATAKHALIGLARTVAKEVAARAIRVNVLCPGPVNNAFQSHVEEGLSTALGTDATAFLNQVIPLGRHADAREIAGMVLFLASDQSSFSTGAVFMADGGMSI